MKKTKRRETSLRLSQNIADSLLVESKKQQITKINLIHNLLEEYFSNGEKIKLPSVNSSSEKIKISMKFSEKHARLVTNEAYRLNITKSAFIEALLIIYFAK